MSHRMRSLDPSSRRFARGAGSGSGLGGTPANGNSVHLGGEVGAGGDVSNQGMSYMPLQPGEFRGGSGRGGDGGAGGDGEGGTGGAVVVEVGPAGGVDERTPLTGGHVPSSSAGAGSKGGFGREL